PYLNVKPLIYSFEHGGLPAGWELVCAPPAKLAAMLASGEIAAAPVSSFATFVNPDLDICPGICIAADGPVRSVLMLSKSDPANVSVVALDVGSLSGANMLKIILAEAYGIRPRFVPMSPEPVSAMLDTCDAALVIGNPAMLHPKDGILVLDVAEEWKKLTGLPAVFALWAGRGMTPELIGLLHDSRRRGMARLEAIAREESARLGMPFEVCYDYLSRTMIYDLGEREAQGLKVFREKCSEHGLLEAEPRSAEAAR
ncbi:MAG: menaquinone biosynthetic enzyme MqnA/MqnD family protein, partial [Armatimonadota bacterium]